MSDYSEDLPDNCTIQNVCKIMTNVMAYAAETDIGTYFINAQAALPEVQL